MKRKLSLILTAAVLTAIIAGLACICRPAGQGRETGATTPPALASTRPAEWAQPVDLPGCPNLHQVAIGLYRGAQPTADGFKELKKLGIKTVVDLRSAHSDDDLIAGLGLALVPIPMTALHAEEEDAVHFLKVVADPKNAPVFVHCQHGSDRTGTMCAVYRIAVQGWTKQAALKEMTEGGYEFHAIFQNLLRFIDRLDIDAIKRKAGLTETKPPE